MKSKIEIQARIIETEEYLEYNKQCDGYCTQEEWWLDVNKKDAEIEALKWVIKTKEEE